MKSLRLLAVVAAALLQAAPSARSEPSPPPAGNIAPKPLYRDPVFDGAADPVVVWNPHASQWWMFYTNRRANAPGLSGVAWVHGTKIGIAQSSDGGATWVYVGTAGITLPAGVGGDQPTLWAPEVRTTHDGVHHMLVTVVPGIFEDWEHPRTIVHLTSSDLMSWKYESSLSLSSDRVIDPCLIELPSGGWRLWYNNERDGKSIYYADSPDLGVWTDHGKCDGVGARPGEGPFVFAWKGHYWMLVDHWKGLGVYRSDDLVHWTGQGADILGVPGHGTDDGVNGGHPGVVVSGGRAFCFYFTHPGRAGTIRPGDKPSVAFRRSSIQVVELKYDGSAITCDRDSPTRMGLVPP
ncbi:MAG TPA: glycosyl hydrolase [Opitutaceae bacterium]